MSSIFYFFNDTTATEIYALSLRDALPIWVGAGGVDERDDREPEGLGVVEQPQRLAVALGVRHPEVAGDPLADRVADRKSTRLNSSHANISYAVFCLKKKL